MNLRALIAYTSAVFALMLAGCGGGTTPTDNPTPVPASYTATLLHSSTMPGSIASAITSDGTIQGGYVTTGFLGQERATIWRGTPDSAVELMGASSQVTGMDGDIQVGYSGVPGTSNALLWRGTAASMVRLHPAGYTSSTANAVAGNTQVGEGHVNATTYHALLWNGTAASVVDLHPTGFVRSSANGASGNVQVGFAEQETASSDRAMLWQGTATSAVDLHPSAYGSSMAAATDGEFQVGHAFPSSGGQAHAMLWQGTAASAVDLNPSDFGGSYAFGVRNGRQVGYAITSDGKFHAMVWNGTAASAHDLHTTLTELTLDGTPLTFTNSLAKGIDANGNIVGEGMVTTVVSGVSETKHYAILWKKNP